MTDLSLFDLSGRKALVTGGAKGLGRACAFALAMGGADVALAGRSEDVGRRVASAIRELGREVMFIRCDVSDRALVMLLGGAVATSSHLTKTSTRAVANTSPEPFSNWALSLAEDVFVVGLGFLALQYPLAALVVAATLLVLIAVFATVIVRTVRRWFSRRAVG